MADGEQRRARCTRGRTGAAGRLRAGVTGRGAHAARFGSVVLPDRVQEAAAEVGLALLLERSDSFLDVVVGDRAVRQRGVLLREDVLPVRAVEAVDHEAL